MYDQHTGGMETTRHRSLVGKGGRKAFVRDKGLARTKKKMSGKTDISNPKNIFLSTCRFQPSYQPETISYEVMKATSINQYFKQRCSHGMT